MIHEIHNTDENGNPAGGKTVSTGPSTGLSIEWQNGPLAVDGVRKDPNGAFVEDVIAAAIGRIGFYQAGKFHCLENAAALGHLLAAAEILAERTRDRDRRQVEGTHQR